MRPERFGRLSADMLWPAPAKLNLFLHVTGRRADGYHLLQTLFQFLDYGDDLSFNVREDGRIQRVAGPADVAAGDDLVVRAAAALRLRTGTQLGADIHLHKRIPLGAGLGGGSSDAATTLVALNALWRTGLTTAQLSDIGLALGADVPVFVHGHAAWAEGVGEQLQAVAPPEPWYLVAAPPVMVSTRDIFSAPALQRSCAPVTLDDFRAGRCGNVCEPVTFERHPEVREVHESLSRFGTARMSGTGASCFVAFASRDEARLAQEQLPATWTHFVARALNQSPLTTAVAAL
jgi:4-diphosphocytidyl-2-C-methyl-D-erythritol kinase